MKLPAFDYATPETVEEAVALLAAGGGNARPISGGQTLLPILAFRMAAPAQLVDLRKLKGLDGISITPQGTTLGARVRWCDIEESAALKAAQPLLAEAITHVAHYQVRKRGTVGGSLAHCDPAAEMPCLAVALDATIVIHGSKGVRRLPAGQFILGALHTALEPDEIITAVELPAFPATRKWGFQELSRRRGDFAMAGIALHFDIAGGVAANAHVAVFGATTRPQRLPSAEAVLNGQAVTPAIAAAVGEAVSASVDPPEDIHATAAYRRSLAGTLAERAVLDAMARG